MFISSYQGPLRVLNGAWELEAERVIVRACDEGRTDICEVAFRFEVIDSLRRYSVEGTAKRQDDGRIVSEPLPVQEAGIGPAQRVTVVLLWVWDGWTGMLELMGIWQQGQDQFGFAELLELFEGADA